MNPPGGSYSYRLTCKDLNVNWKNANEHGRVFQSSGWIGDETRSYYGSQFNLWVGLERTYYMIFATRHSQWGTWFSFCEMEGSNTLPLQKGIYCISSVGYPLNGTRRAWSVQCVDYPLLDRGSENATSGNLPAGFLILVCLPCNKGVSRMGVGELSGIVGLVRPIRWETTVNMGLGMTTYSLRMLRDCSVCFFAYCFNGLQNICEISLEQVKICIERDKVTDRLNIVKERE